MDKHVQVDGQCDRVRRLNDQFRCFGTGRGSFMLTSGVDDLGLGFVSAAVAAVRVGQRVSTRTPTPDRLAGQSASTIVPAPLILLLIVTRMGRDQRPGSQGE